jgi:diacylglycerol kinase (ATP)
MAAGIGRELEARSVSFELFDTAWPEGFSTFTQAWVVGGDGTLNFFINQYPGISLPLSIFPGGSGNDFHWMLYGGLSVAGQVAGLLGGQTMPIDAGTCNGRLFLNGAGIGFDGAIVKDLVGRKKLSGKATYLLSILKNIMRYRETECTLLIGRETIRERTFLLSVANGKRYGGGFLVAPRAVADDGLLDISLVGAISPLKRMRYLPVMERGDHLGLPFVEYRQAPAVVVTSDSPLHAHLDGEYLCADRFEIAVLPKKFLFARLA